MKQEEFVIKILEVLSPMPDVSAIKAKGHEVESELIAKILRPKNQLDQSDCDTFLFRATRSWWLAKGKMRFISNVKQCFITSKAKLP